MTVTAKKPASRKPSLRIVGQPDHLADIDAARALYVDGIDDEGQTA